MPDMPSINDKINTQNFPDATPPSLPKDLVIGKAFGRKIAALLAEKKPSAKPQTAATETASKVKELETVSVKNRPKRPASPAPKFSSRALRIPKNPTKTSALDRGAARTEAYTKQLEQLGEAPKALQAPEEEAPPQNEVSKKPAPPRPKTANPFTPQSFPELLRQNALANESLPRNTVGREFLTVEVNFNKAIGDLKELGKQLMVHVAPEQQGVGELKTFFRGVDRLEQLSQQLVSQLALAKSDEDIAKIMQQIDLKTFKPVVDGLEALMKKAPVNSPLFGALDHLSKKLGYAGGFNDLSSRPIQKLMRYPLIMAEMSRKAPPDHPIHMALKKVLEETSYVNKR